MLTVLQHILQLKHQVATRVAGRAGRALRLCGHAPPCMDLRDVIFRLSIRMLLSIYCS